MPIKVDYEQFRFAKAEYIEPSDAPIHGTEAMNDFRKAAHELVRQIQRVGWDIPDVDVLIRYYGRGQNILKHCSEVSFACETKDGQKETFQIRYFDKAGPRKGSYNRLANISNVEFGKLKLDLYSDGSGNDWRKTDEWALAKTFIDPLLEKLKAMPSKEGFDRKTVEGDANLRAICKPEPNPVPQGFPILYTWVEQSEAVNASKSERLLSDNERDAEYEKGNLYTVSGNGWRFCIPEGGLKWEEMPPGAHEGYNFASADPNEKARGLVMGINREYHPIEIRLKSLHDIFIADMAPFFEGRERAYEDAENTGVQDWVKGEYGDILRSSVKTFVPAAEYKGGYKKPVYCIGRQLDEREARLISGPVSVYLKDNTVVAELKDDITEEVITLHKAEPHISQIKTAIEVANAVTQTLGTNPKIDPAVTQALDAFRQKRLAEAKKENQPTALIM